MKVQAGLVEVDLRVFITFLSLFTLKSYITVDKFFSLDRNE